MVLRKNSAPSHGNFFGGEGLVDDANATVLDRWNSAALSEARGIRFALRFRTCLAPSTPQSALLSLALTLPGAGAGVLREPSAGREAP